MNVSGRVQIFDHDISDARERHKAMRDLHDPLPNLRRHRCDISTIPGIGLDGGDPRNGAKQIPRLQSVPRDKAYSIAEDDNSVARPRSHGSGGGHSRAPPKRRQLGAVHRVSRRFRPRQDKGTTSRNRSEIEGIEKLLKRRIPVSRRDCDQVQAWRIRIPSAAAHLIGISGSGKPRADQILILPECFVPWKRDGIGKKAVRGDRNRQRRRSMDRAKEQPLIDPTRHRKPRAIGSRSPNNGIRQRNAVGIGHQEPEFSARHDRRKRPGQLSQKFGQITAAVASSGISLFQRSARAHALRRCRHGITDHDAKCARHVRDIRAEGRIAGIHKDDAHRVGSIFKSTMTA